MDWKTKYLPEWYFTQYVAALEANTGLAHDHRALGGEVEPGLVNHRVLAQEMLVKTVDMNPMQNAAIGTRLCPRILLYRLTTINRHQVMYCAKGKKLIAPSKPAKTEVFR